MRTFPSLTTNAILVAFQFFVCFLIIPTHCHHAWDPYRWQKSELIQPIYVQNCHNESTRITKLYSINWDSLFNLVLYNWNNVPLDPTTMTRSNRKSPSFIRILSQPCDLSKQGRKGVIQTFNSNYGKTGWLGLTQLYANPTTNYITRVTVKVNEYYMDLDNYKRFDNEIAWQQVLCHEIGHGLALSHQDMTGSDFDTCLDYSTDLNNPFSKRTRYR